MDKERRNGDVDITQFQVEKKPIWERITQIDVNQKVLPNDSDFGVAQTIENERGTIYLLKVYSGSFYDPNNTAYFGSASSLNSKHSGTKVWKYRKVTKEIYDMYIQFLKTRNANYLLTAQRGMNS